MKRDFALLVPTQREQQGIALIAVLMIVLLLAIAGAMAVRSSQTSLDMTTSSQVNELLFQSSDVPLAQLEQVGNTPFNNSSSGSVLDEMNTVDGPIGYLRINGENFKGLEYVLCYQPTMRSTLYAGANQHRVVASADGKATFQNATGYCQLTNSNAYTSKRGAVATQVAMTRPTINDTLVDDIYVQNEEITADDTSTTGDENKTAKVRTHTKQPFAGTTGTDMQSVGASDDVTGDVYFRAYTTSVLPALAISSTPGQINECMKLPIGGMGAGTNKTSQMNCLNNTDTPYNVQVQDYIFMKAAKAE